jgi:glycosyltransferase involved in cell wall biosynthesis
MSAQADYGSSCRLVIWHTEGTAISGLLSWMWRLKKSLGAAGIELTLASLELQPFRFPQVCAPEKIYDTRIRTPREFIAFLKTHQDAVHIINHSFEYVDLIQKLRPELFERLTLVGICHTDQDYYYHHLSRLDERLSGIIAVSEVCAQRLESRLPHRRGAIPVLPDWNMPVGSSSGSRVRQPGEPLRVLFNGRLLHVQKRVLDLPQISRHLAAENAPVELTVVGEGPDLPRLREAFGTGRHIMHRLLGARAPWEMSALLAVHDVFLQVSEFEGASVSLMEAMVSGLVPVVTATDSGTELLKDGRNALLCSIADTAEVARNLADLAHAPARISALSCAAFETARDYLHELDYPTRLRRYLDEVREPALQAL